MEEQIIKFLKEGGTGVSVVDLIRKIRDVP